MAVTASIRAFEMRAAEQSALMALVENVQRADLSFWEEAEGYRRLLTISSRGAGDNSSLSF